MTQKIFDTIVIGSGHAGIEAACASARIGATTLLITKKFENLGEMSCNPAIGGVAKGTIVKEIDALDGVMAKAIDKAGIHFRILNASKGPAVHSPRAQADRISYKKAIVEILNEEYGFDLPTQEKNKIKKHYQGQNFEILFESVADLQIEGDEIRGVILENNEKIAAKSVILTAGTFLRGQIHIGRNKIKAGRINENPSDGISQTLQKFNFRLSRLKTGTPPRILKSSINFSELEEQPSDEKPQPFSYLNNKITTPQTICHITYTNQETHEIIQKNLTKSAMYGGKISGKGPRYCPSIEDKINRFFDKDRHQIFLEPEGIEQNFDDFFHDPNFSKAKEKFLEELDKEGVSAQEIEALKPNYAPHELIYPNGISTSLPLEIQIKFVRSIKGLENAVIAQAGYAIEYDFIDPTELKPTLETKKIANLFFAGQINGTTGYEEAGGQGIVAGANAALKALESNQEFAPKRHESYIGVMIDDLTNLGTQEPYRMLTSRSEYRLNLRADNSDLRLSELAQNFGLISQKRAQFFQEKRQKIQQATEILQNLKISPTKLAQKNIEMRHDGVVRSAFELLGFANLNPLAKNGMKPQEENENKVPLYFLSKIWPEEIAKIDEKTQAQIAINALYEPYIKRQEKDIELLRQDENIKIPPNFDYSKIQSLSNEVREKLNLIQPINIASALKIQGVTPAAAMAIIIHLKKKKS